MLLLALFVVFMVGFLTWYNIRIFLRVLDKSELVPKDLCQSVIIGLCAAFLFYYFT